MANATIIVASQSTPGPLRSRRLEADRLTIAALAGSAIATSYGQTSGNHRIAASRTPCPSCCQLGWNCTTSWDEIMGKWTYELTVLCRPYKSQSIDGGQRLSPLSRSDPSRSGTPTDFRSDQNPWLPSPQRALTILIASGDLAHCACEPFKNNGVSTIDKHLLITIINRPRLAIPDLADDS